MRRQMQLLLAQEQHAELLARFTQKALGGRAFHLSYMYPEREDVMADLYYYRSLAFVHADDLTAAEADLRIMNDKRAKLSYRSGEAIHDRVWLRLGNFYREHLGDDGRALGAYTNILSRTTWATWGRPRKPALTRAGKSGPAVPASDRCAPRTFPALGGTSPVPRR